MKGTGKRKRKEKPEPVRFGWKDHLQLWGVLFGLCAAVLGTFHLETTSRQRHAFDETIARWRINYHLTDDQAHQLRAMEESFHGSGDPFFRPTHNFSEAQAHERAMAAVMNPADGERFLQTMSKEAGLSSP